MDKRGDPRPVLDRAREKLLPAVDEVVKTCKRNVPAPVESRQGMACNAKQDTVIADLTLLLMCVVVVCIIATDVQAARYGAVPATNYSSYRPTSGVAGSNGSHSRMTYRHSSAYSDDSDDDDTDSD